MSAGFVIAWVIFCGFVCIGSAAVCFGFGRLGSGLICVSLAGVDFGLAAWVAVAS